MKDNNIIGWLGSAVSYLATAVQTNETLQIVQLIISIVASVLALSFTIWKWIKKAKADGKITTEEIEELHDIVKDGLENVNESMKGKKDNENKN